MPSRQAVTACLFAALFLLPPATGANAQMPADIAAKVKEIGRVIDPPKTAPLYVPLHAKEPYQGVLVSRDIKYGADPRQALDLFIPDIDATSRAVFIFVHGGGFVGGNKRPPGSPFYDNFMLFAAKNDMIGVNATYRLAPAHPWPAAIDDIAAAVKWVRANIGQYGGDPERIFLVGSSAGAAIVAGFIADPKLYPEPNKIGVKAVLLLAGVYDFTLYSVGKNEEAYLGADRSKYDERSPLKGIMASRVPLLVSYAELDPPDQVKQGEILYANLCNKNRCPTKVFLPNHSHMSTVYAVNTDDTQLTDAMLKFMASVK